MGTDNSQHLSRLDRNTGTNGEDASLPIFLDEFIFHLYRIAFTVWHTALHLEKEHARLSSYPPAICTCVRIIINYVF